MKHDVVLVIITALEVITVVCGFYGLIQWKMDHNRNPKAQ